MAYNRRLWKRQAEKVEEIKEENVEISSTISSISTTPGTKIFRHHHPTYNQTNAPGILLVLERKKKSKCV